MTDGRNVQRPAPVSGAAGNQGDAVARNLFERGFRVRAPTRDSSRPVAEPLAEAGAEVVRVDLEDRSSLDRALEGVYSVFSVQNSFEAGYEGGVRQGSPPRARSTRV